MAWDAPTIPLKLPDLGNALVQGAHAGYFVGKARQEGAEEDRRQQAQPFVSAAMGGDQGAMAKVASGDPKTALVLSQALSRLDAQKLAQTKAAADFTAHASNTLLQADPKDRAAVYQQMLELGRSQGHDMSTLPPQYSPAFDNQARLLRGQSKDVLDLLQKQADEAGRNQRHKPAGGAAFDTPSWGGKVPISVPVESGPPQGDGGPQPSPGTPPVAATASPVGQPPAVVPATPVAPASAAPDGFRPMGHRDQSGQLVPAVINGQPVLRHPQTGEMRLGPAATAVESQIAQGDGPGPTPTVVPGVPGPIATPPGTVQSAPPALPPVMRAATPAAPTVVVHEVPPGYEPARQGGIPYVNKQGFIPLISKDGPPILLKPSDEKPGARFEDIKGPNGQIIGQRDTSSNQYHPLNQPPATADVPKDAKGEAVYQALNDGGDPGRAAEIRSIVDGDTPIPSPASRVPNAIETRRLVFQAAEPGFTDATHATRMATKKSMATGKIGDVLTAQGTLFNHLNELQATAEDLRNTPYPVINKLGNVIGLNTGDPRVTNMAEVKHRVSEEAEKYFGGTGGTTVSGLAQAQKELNEAQSPEQLEGAIGKMVKLVAGRQSELTAQINRGLQYPKERQLTADDLLTPEAKASRDAILQRFPSARTPNSVAGKLGLAKEAPAPGGRPPLESFQK